MNRGEEIKDLSALAEYLDIHVPAMGGATLRKAIAALQTKQLLLNRSRWDGCEWCYDEIPFDSEDMELELQHPLEDEPRMVCPQFCPMCGRPLTEQAWVELERRLNGEKTD